MTELWGRDAELARLTELLRTLRSGGGGSLLLRGEAGIGKTALLDAAARRAEEQGLTVLTAHGSPAEARLPFGALHQLLWPLLRDDALPRRARESLRAVLGDQEVAVPDPYGVAFAALDLLVEAAQRDPLLVVAEDAHWFDRPSADVLGFVVRRVRGEPIALLGAVRDGHDDPFAGHGLAELAVGPLTPELSHALLERHGADLPLRTRARLLEAARGNPLALRELPSAVRQKEESDHTLSVFLPLSTRLERAFAARLPDLPAPTRTALLALAADTHCTLAELLDAVAEIHGGPATVAVVEPAVAAGLVECDGAAVRFRHPLVASAVYQRASLGDRLAVHRALGGLLAAEPNRAVWHRATAAPGPDRELMEELRDFGERAVARGATSAAVEALERAAALAQDDNDRTTLILHAAQAACELPEGKARAAALLDSTRLRRLDTANQARRALLEELAGLRPSGDPHFVRTLVRHALAVHGIGERELARQLLWTAAARCWMDGAGIEVRTWFAGVLDTLDPRMEHPGTVYTLAYLLPVERGRAILERLTRLPAADGDAALLYAVAVKGLLGEFPDTVDHIAAATSAVRAQGRVAQTVKYLSVWAGSDVWGGAWDRAIANSLECERLATATDEPVWRLMALGHRLGVAALRAETQHAEALAAEILSDPRTPHYLRSITHRALGINALNAGRGAEAYERLSRLFDPADPVHHYAVTPFTFADLADAARAADRVEEARVLLGDLEPTAAREPAAAVAIGLNHARALLAGDLDAEKHYTAALAVDLTAWPHYRGRLHLAYGQWLRRRRRHTESRGHLRLALDLLRELGAGHWAEQARRELRAAGQSSPEDAPGPAALTAQELQIAGMAARGMTNREIGRHFHLSHRTVGAHLYRIFPKLGITSRGQLPHTLTEHL